MAITIRNEIIQVRPGLEINTLSAIRAVLEDRPMGGTVKDYRKMIRLLEGLDAVASGTLPDLSVELPDAELLAGLLEAQQWRTLARPWMEWVEATIANLRNTTK